MFYYISGKLAHLDPAFAVIDAGGVGYILQPKKRLQSSYIPIWRYAKTELSCLVL